MRRALAIALAIGMLWALTLGSIGYAAWSAQSSGDSDALTVATSIAAGATPTATVGGTPPNDVTVSWAATLLPDGTPVAGYVVAAYGATAGMPRTINASCAGIVAATSCVEVDAPDGAWQYSVAPRHQAWAGPEGPPSEAVTVDTAAPSPTALTLVNGRGGGVGLINPTIDSLTITFSEALAVASICSAWTPNGANQSLSGSDVVVAVADNAGQNALTVTTSQCTLHIGTVGLGTDYLAGTTDATFSGIGASSSRIQWDATTDTLTVHFGALASGALRTTPVAPETARYTPDGAITDIAGNAIVTTPFSSATQRF